MSVYPPSEYQIQVITISLIQMDSLDCKIEDNTEHRLKYLHDKQLQILENDRMNCNQYRIKNKLLLNLDI